MTLEELEMLLERHDRNAKEYGLSDNLAASLVIRRSKPPQGEKILTPFGRCVILNSVFRDGMVQTVFGVSRKQLVALIQKIKKEYAT